MIENFIGQWNNAIHNSTCDIAIDYYEQMVANGFAKTRQQVTGKSKLKQDNSSFLLTDSNIINNANPEVHKPILDVIWNQYFPLYIEQYPSLETVEGYYIREMKMQKNSVGQGYHEWHFETDTRETSARMFNYQIFLNDVEQGGETEFLYYGVRIKPSKGTLIIYPGQFTHTHRGNPPISNEKYIINGWIEI